MKKSPNLRFLFTSKGESFNNTEWNIYPRPQLKRDSFLSLNGVWDFHISTKIDIPEIYDEKINVPFAPQSLLSGICKDIPDEFYLFYKRTFTLEKDFNKGRIILNFGAVDQYATIYINGNEVGKHTGGYEPFSFDITEFIREENTIVVVCKDNLNSQLLPYGKQSTKRGGMWYTPVSGIWQTVWLESVPETYIKSLKIDTDDKIATVTVEGINDGVLTIIDMNDELDFPIRKGRAEIKIENVKVWSPETPNIYEFTVSSGEDTVKSYLAFRKIETKLINGIPRICLNGKPYFFHGLLDQGYFSDGIFTPASPEEYKNDILSMKKLGFNTLRKHIKVEPQIFYYYCDIFGMAVFQDMVNNSDYNFFRDTALPTALLKKFPDKLLHRKKSERCAFVDGMTATVKTLYNHPSILYWTIFNEGWGQFNSQQMYELLKKLDSGRIIDSTSGWFKSGQSDVESLHVYFKPIRIKKAEKPIILSEFGGYSYKVKDHSFNPEKTYGYRFFNEQKSFMDALEKLYYNEIIPAIDKGLCGAVYTQVSDVEDETNGLLTYDRKLLKVDGDKMMAIAKKIEEYFDSLPLDKKGD